MFNPKNFDLHLILWSIPLILFFSFIDDMNIWLSPGIDPSTYSLESYDKFYQMLRILCYEVFGLKNLTNVCSIFIEDGEKIAFNWKHSLYFNLHYFVYQITLPPLYKASFWYMTFCHELGKKNQTTLPSWISSFLLCGCLWPLRVPSAFSGFRLHLGLSFFSLAHNVVHDHDARHEYVLQIIASKYMNPFEKIQPKLCQIITFQEQIISTIHMIPQSPARPVASLQPTQLPLDYAPQPTHILQQPEPEPEIELEPVPQLPPDLPTSLMRAVTSASIPLSYFTILVDALLNMGYPGPKVYNVIELMVNDNNIKPTTPIDDAVLMIFHGLS